MFADKENKPAIGNFNLCTENGLANLFTEEKSGRAITPVTDKEIHRGNEARSQRPEVFESEISQM